MKKVLVLISLMAFLGAGCAGTAKIQKDMEMRTDELKYEHDNRTAEEKRGTLEIRSFVIDDVLQPNTTVTRTFSIILPLIIINVSYHGFQCKLGYNQIINDYKEFMRDSFNQELIRNSVYMNVESQGALTLEIHIKKVTIAGAIRGGWAFIPVVPGNTFGSGYVADPVDVDILAEVVLKKGETIVFEDELHGKHITNMINVITPPEYTTVMIDALAAAIKNLNAKIVRLVNQQEITQEETSSQLQKEFTMAQAATSPTITGDTYKEPVTGMEFVFVKGGCYRMGVVIDGGRQDEKPVQEVCVDDFYMGRYEVTQSQWKGVMGNNPSKGKKGNDYPVDSVSWESAHTYALKLKYKTGLNYRLPTEAEWEYAARSGGKDERWPGTNQESELQEYAWFAVSTPEYLDKKPVGLKRSNGLGLFDMAGNLKEWVSDWYSPDYYKIRPQHNPQGPLAGELKVMRGGSFISRSSESRTTYRDKQSNTKVYDDTGFRLVIQVR